MKTKLMMLAASALASSSLFAGLTAYDNKISADNAAGLSHVGISTSTLTFDGTNSEPFNFGAVSGSSTLEFILSGDPVAGGQDGYLAVGSNSTWNLRYEQWNDTGALGFTHLGVLDYLFTPVAPAVAADLDSPTELTHVAYRWDQASTTMDLYLDGVLTGTNSAAGAYQMPTGSGWLGNNAGRTEGMLGVIERVTVYNEAIPEAAIIDHANAWLGEAGLTLTVTTDGTDLTFNWPSRAGKVYDLLSDTLSGPVLATDPTTWSVFDSHEDIAATPDENMLVIPRPADPQRFFVIQERPAPPLLTEDFESGQGNWAIGQSDGIGNTEWDIGAPSGVVGPISGAGGSANCLGTNLGGDYGPDSDIFALSPAFDVGAGGACVSFMQIRDTDGGLDGGFLRVLDVNSNPIPGAADIPIDFSSFDADWVKFTGDLPPEAAGMTVRLEFQFVSDNDGQEFSGWYVDDVEVTAK